MNYKNIYFVGIGGIGMSAIARYFKHEGKSVAGYDRLSTPLTLELESVGMNICYDDDTSLIPSEFLDKCNTLIVYTPAIPSENLLLRYFIENGYTIVKRSKVLAEVSRGKYVMAIAGTHGKSSTTTMVAYFNHCSSTNGTGSAFLGAISKNFGTNMLLGSGDRVAIEADEFDRSFLQLHPNVALITSVDADHLDIYGDHKSLLDGFTEFTSNIVNGGTLIYRSGLPLTIDNENITIYTYSISDEESDFYASNIFRLSTGYYSFDIVCPDRVIKNCELGVAGRVNIENCIGAVAMVWVAGFNEEKLRNALLQFRGLRRRFDIRISNDNYTYIDDYAHHPTEIEATLTSIRDMYPGRDICAVFQPHLYSRTRDFVDGFASSLSLANSVILLPIYPAREEPIEGVTSKIIFDKITITDKQLIEKNQLLDYLSNKNLEILVTFGAGDIDVMCDPIEKMKKY